MSSNEKIETYSRKNDNTIISFLKDNAVDFHEYNCMYLEILTIDDYAQRHAVKDVWKDLYDKFCPFLPAWVGGSVIRTT